MRLFVGLPLLGVVSTPEPHEPLIYVANILQPSLSSWNRSCPTARATPSRRPC
jgi:hypothetical protein